MGGEGGAPGFWGFGGLGDGPGARKFGPLIRVGGPGGAKGAAPRRGRGPGTLGEEGRGGGSHPNRGRGFGGKTAGDEGTPGPQLGATTPGEHGGKKGKHMALNLGQPGKGLNPKGGKKKVPRDSRNGPPRWGGRGTQGGRRTAGGGNQFGRLEPGFFGGGLGNWGKERGPYVFLNPGTRGGLGRISGEGRAGGRERRRQGGIFFGKRGENPLRGEKGPPASGGRRGERGPSNGGYGGRGPLGFGEPQRGGAPRGGEKGGGGGLWTWGGPQPGPQKKKKGGEGEGEGGQPKDKEGKFFFFFLN